VENRSRNRSKLNPIEVKILLGQAFEKIKIKITKD